jgi:hypothetical protein
MKIRTSLLVITWLAVCALNFAAAQNNPNTVSSNKRPKCRGVSGALSMISVNGRFFDPGNTTLMQAVQKLWGLGFTLETDGLSPAFTERELRPAGPKDDLFVVGCDLFLALVVLCDKHRRKRIMRSRSQAWRCESHVSAIGRCAGPSCSAPMVFSCWSPRPVVRCRC